MEVQFAMVCDHANTTDNGKLNVMGEFDRILTPEFPCIHPMMFFVAKLLASVADGDEPALELRVVGEDGEFAAAPLELRGRITRTSPGTVATLRLVLQIGMPRFEAPGIYSFELYADGRQLHVVQLRVERIPGSASA